MRFSTLAPLRLILLALLALVVPAARAAEPPAVPLLRIETGMHTAMINRIATDAANRYLVTGSDDKTVRVWSLRDGALLRTLRPPLGEGNEGKIFAVALSPAGATVACGGWTSNKESPLRAAGYFNVSVTFYVKCERAESESCASRLEHFVLLGSQQAAGYRTRKGMNLANASISSTALFDRASGRS